MKHAADTTILPRWRSLSEGEIEEKAPGDLVTVADRESEAVITRELARAYPGALILGEEATAADPGLLDEFRTAEHAFTIDPIDGTKNFVNGSKDFAVMVAETREGQVTRSWIWQPAREVSFTAERGHGAYRNATRLSPVVASEDPADWRGVTARTGLKKGKYGSLPRLHSAWWCCGVDYPKIAMGRADFVIYRHVWPWDHAPGSLLLEEIGGRLIHGDGSAYTPSGALMPWLIGGVGDIPNQVLPDLAEYFAAPDDQAIAPEPAGTPRGPRGPGEHS